MPRGTSPEQTGLVSSAFSLLANQNLTIAVKPGDLSKKLMQRQILPLYAGAVQVAEKYVCLLIGRPGSGKTTLALGLHDLGFSLFADEVIRTDLVGGKVYATPVSPFVWLRSPDGTCQSRLLPHEPSLEPAEVAAVIEIKPGHQPASISRGTGLDLFRSLSVYSEDDSWKTQNDLKTIVFDTFSALAQKPFFITDPWSASFRMAELVRALQENL